jgi:hypothetical protein
MDTDAVGQRKEPGTEVLVPLPEVRPHSERPSTFLANVDNLVGLLWPERDWRVNLDAITNKSSITGKVEIDRAFAAKRVQEAALDVVSMMHSDFDRAETLLAFVGAQGVDSRNRTALVSAAEHLNSTYEKNRILAALVRSERR